jgi:hypothetical protein
VIVNTHTDGVNACEENGGIGLLALAEYFSHRPAESRGRNLCFAFITGHFQLPQFGVEGQASGRWLRDHRELWDGAAGHARAVAALTAEHLGAMEWADTKDLSAFVPTGLPERELFYTGNPAMHRLLLASLEDAGNCFPARRRVLSLRPKGSLYFGEGEPFYKKGIPTISLVPSPLYLCAAAPGGCIEKLSAELLYAQALSFAAMAERLLALPAAAFGAQEKPAFSMLQWLMEKRSTGT